MKTKLSEPNQAGLKQIDLSTAIHLAFDELELGDLALRLAVRPTRCYGGYRIGFVNEQAEWKTEEVVVYDDGYSDANATLTDRVEIVGLTSRDQAWKEASGGTFFTLTAHSFCAG